MNDYTAKKGIELTTVLAYTPMSTGRAERDLDFQCKREYDRPISRDILCLNYRKGGIWVLS